MKYIYRAVKIQKGGRVAYNAQYQSPIDKHWYTDWWPSYDTPERIRAYVERMNKPDDPVIITVLP